MYLSYWLLVMLKNVFNILKYKWDLSVNYFKKVELKDNEKNIYNNN